MTKITTQINNIVISIAGKNNFDNHFIFNKWRSNCNLWSGIKYEASSTFEINKVNFTPNHYNLWYGLDIIKDNYINDRIRVRINSQASKSMFQTLRRHCKNWRSENLSVEHKKSKTIRSHDLKIKAKCNKP